MLSDIANLRKGEVALFVLAGICFGIFFGMSVGISLGKCSSGTNDTISKSSKLVRGRYVI